MPEARLTAAPAGALARRLDFPRTAWILFGGTFVNRFGSFVMPFLALYVVQRGYPAALAGATVGAMGLGVLVAPVLGGPMADRLGRPVTIAVSMLSWAVLALALAWSPAALLPPLAAAAGLASELYRPASNALVADVVPAGRRVTAYAVYRFAVNVGTASGIALAGFLADRSFLFLFVGDALTSAAFGVLVLLALREVGGERPAAGGDAGTIAMVVRDRPFLVLLLLTCISGAIYMQSISTVPFQVRALGLPAHTYGLLFTVNGLLVILFQIPLVGWAQRLRTATVLAAGMAVLGGGFGLLALSRAAPLLVLGAFAVLWTVGEMLIRPMSMAYVADAAPPGYQGRFQGAFQFSWGLGFVIGPTVGAAAFAWHPNGLWIGCAVAGLLAGALAARLPDRAPVEPG